MRVKDVIERLQKVNPEAEFEVIADNQKQPFTWTHGGGDGCTEKVCDSFGPYLTYLNDDEQSLTNSKRDGG